jgi:hypothetical protein
MDDTRNYCMNLVEKPLWKWLFRTLQSLKDNITMGARDKSLRRLEVDKLVQDCAQWQSLSLAVVNIWILLLKGWLRQHTIPNFNLLLIPSWMSFQLLTAMTKRISYDIMQLSWVSSNIFLVLWCLPKKKRVARLKHFLKTDCHFR